MKGAIRGISEIDRVVHEPARLKILMFLQAVGEVDFLYLQLEGEFTQGNLSGHLRKLEEAGYVAIQKTFKGRMPLTICRLTTEGERALAGYCMQMSEILQSRAVNGGSIDA
jgi:DNA-binding transcriptional ArsR family regulator